MFGPKIGSIGVSRREKFVKFVVFITHDIQEKIIRYFFSSDTEVLEASKGWREYGTSSTILVSTGTGSSQTVTRVPCFFVRV